MPNSTKPDTKIDPQLLNRIVRWAVNYFVNPKLGAGKKLPTIKEINALFPDSGITPEHIQTYLYDKLQIKTLEELTQDPEAIDEKLEHPKEEPKLQVATRPIPQKTDTSQPQPKPKGQVSAMGVLGEIEVALKNAKINRELRAGLTETLHRELTPKLEDQIAAVVEKALPKVVNVKLPQAELQQVTAEIAAETTGEVLKEIGRTANQDQIAALVADSITQTIITHEKFGSAIKVREDKIFKKVFSDSQKIATTNDKDLQKAAVLGKVATILQKPTPQVAQTLQNIVDQAVELNTPLASSENRIKLQLDVSTFINTYQTSFASQIIPHLQPNATPTFEVLAKAQSTAFAAASQKTAIIRRYNLDSRIGFILGLNNDPSAQEAAGLGSAQPTFTTFTRGTPFLGQGVGIALNSDRAKKEAYLALLSHDKEKLNRALRETTTEIENFKKQKTLSYRDRKQLRLTQKKLGILTAVQIFSAKRTRETQTYQAYFALLKPPQGGSGLTWASQNAWLTTNALVNTHRSVYSPQSQVNLPYFAQRSFGGLAFQIGNFRLGNIKSLLGKSKAIGPQIGMGAGKTVLGKASLPMMIAMPAVGLLGKIAKGSALVGGMALLYFMKLGMAAALGAMIGGTIGAMTGAVAGAYIGATIGSVVIPIPVVGTVVGGAGGAIIGSMIGGAIGVIAGGLIGYGLASGTTAAVGAGVGTAAGGTIGAVAGYTAGSVIASTIWAGLFAVCVGSVICAPFAPLMIVAAPAVGALGGFLGGAIGAVVGSVIGGIVGFAIGKTLGFIGSQIGNIFSGIKGVFTGGGATISGGPSTMGAAISGGIGSAIGGFASSLLGAGGSLFGGGIGAISSIGNALVGGISGASIPSALISAPILTGIGSVAVGGTIVGIITATTFFSEDKDNALQQTCDNEFFLCTKTATPDKIPNTELTTGKNISYQITLEAKKKIFNIKIVDDMTVTRPDGSQFDIPVDDPPCSGAPTEMNQGDPKWECTFNKEIKGQEFADALVTNIIKVTATPQGQEELTDSIAAYVTVGDAQVPGGRGSGPCDIFEFAGDWIQQEIDNVNSICAQIDKSPIRSQMLIPKVTMVRVENGSLGSGVCGTVPGAGIINIGCDMTEQTFTHYVVIHELGHVVSSYNTDKYLDYLNSGAYSGRPDSEGLMPTYPFSASEITWTDPRNESFAELFSGYIVYKYYNFKARNWSGYPGGAWVNLPNGWGSFPTKSLLHYNFAKTTLFGGTEY